ncbi:hypothetical protein [Paenibacillus sp. An7]|uniref:hypothetical protein n=1 Tax=Paenibacillus sp. An7 TaxID=2689577 RepID=UPI00135BC2C1|nr:hypothetical protein [Paenibacillus sp. An7]
MNLVEGSTTDCIKNVKLDLTSSATIGADVLLEELSHRINETVVLPISSSGYVMITQRLYHEKNFFIYNGKDLINFGEVAGIQEVTDPILEGAGLKLLRLHQYKYPQKQEEDALYYALLESMILYRTTLCTVGLELAKKHLSPRTSGGGPTIQNQLVKANFTDIVSILELIKSTNHENIKYTGQQIEKKLKHIMIHNELDRAFGILQKLAGGHGFVHGPIMQSFYISQVSKNLLIPDKEGMSV